MVGGAIRGAFEERFPAVLAGQAAGGEAGAAPEAAARELPAEYLERIAAIGEKVRRTAIAAHSFLLLPRAQRRCERRAVAIFERRRARR